LTPLPTFDGEVICCFCFGKKGNLLFVLAIMPKFTSAFYVKRRGNHDIIKGNPCFVLAFLPEPWDSGKSANFVGPITSAFSGKRRGNFWQWILPKGNFAWILPKGKFWQNSQMQFFFFTFFFHFLFF